MATSFEERVKRLEYRSKEADNALKQLTAYANVLKQVADNSTEKPTAVLELEKENRQLNEDIKLLKERLIELEILNGRPHISTPTAVIPTTSGTVTKPSVTKEPPPMREEGGAKKGVVKESVVKEGGASVEKTTKDKQTKQTKQPKKEKGGGATGGGATIDKPLDVSRLDFRIGKIVTVKQHPDADGLYVEEIELGEDRPRTVCSGLVKFIPIEQMQDRLVIVLCNLKPAKMRGILSEAMVMCASTPEKIELLDPPPTSLPGDRVTFEGYTGSPDAQLNPKKKIFEQIAPDLMTSKDGVAMYKGVPFTVEGKGICHSQTLNNTLIK